MSEPNVGPTPPTVLERVFLVVLDASEELSLALRYACRRAYRTGGRVALLYVIEPSDLQSWMAVEDIVRAEQEEEAQEVVKKYATQVQETTGQMPVVFIREGKRQEELLKLIDEEPRISVLVLGANTGTEGPGPLVQLVVGKMAGRLRVPVTVVPGGLTEAQVDALT
ncbi:MAG TPA: universal stress protein [Alphaproteobacteria bacterium]|nr:universal stress protein [Alphaproteobacteria bacterium]